MLPPITSVPCRVTVGGKTYLLGLKSETEKDRTASADRFCKDMGYGGAGTSDNFQLLPQFQPGANGWATYDPVTSATCTGPTCPVVGVVECFQAGKSPLPKDGAGNVGCKNVGKLWGCVSSFFSRVAVVSALLEGSLSGRRGCFVHVCGQQVELTTCKNMLESWPSRRVSW